MSERPLNVDVDRDAETPDFDSIRDRMAEEPAEALADAGGRYRLRTEWAPSRHAYPDTAAGEAAYLLACRVRSHVRLKATAGEAAAAVNEIGGSAFDTAGSAPGVGTDPMARVADARALLDAVESNVRRAEKATRAFKRTVESNQLDAEAVRLAADAADAETDTARRLAEGHMPAIFGGR